MIKVVQTGDYLRFIHSYDFTDIDGAAITLDKEDLAIVVKVDYEYDSVQLGTDELICYVLLATNLNERTVYFRFNFSVHQDWVKILKPTEAAKVLYDK